MVHSKCIRYAIDRARRALSWSNFGLTWSKVWANPFRKYSNPDLRYPTCNQLSNKTYKTVSDSGRVRKKLTDFKFYRVGNNIIPGG